MSTIIDVHIFLKFRAGSNRENGWQLLRVWVLGQV